MKLKKDKPQNKDFKYKTTSTSNIYDLKIDQDGTITIFAGTSKPTGYVGQDLIIFNGKK